MSDSRPFGVLRLMGLEFAIDAQALEQVIEWPSALQAHPLQGGALLGMFSLRGKALPLIDLRPLLAEAGAVEREPTSMVAIVNHQNRRMGIAVNGVSDVMKLESRHLCHLDGLGAALGLLPELALIASGRMIYLLDLEALFDAPQVMTARSRDSGQAALTHEQTHVLHHLLVLDCNGRRYAVDARAITELVERPEIVPGSFGGDYCLGVTNRRGVDVPVLNMDRVLGMDSPPGAGAKSQLLVLTSRQGYRVGLNYDRMVAIVRTRANDILPLPTYGLRQPELFAGVIGTQNGDQALLLDHQALLERPETLNFARIYQTSAPGLDSGATRSGALNQTCLVFQAPVQFVVPLDQVLEILDMPTQFVALSQPESHLLGTFNLRGEQIPLVCLSSLIEGAPQPEDRPQRVLLVRGEFSSFGLVVTRTDSIESFTHPSSEHPAGWETGMGDGGSNGRVRSLVSIGKGEQNRWMTLINLRNVVKTLEQSARPPGGRRAVERLDVSRAAPAG